MENMFNQLNHSFGGPVGSVIGAIIIFIIGFFAALLISGAFRKVLAKTSLNQRMNSSTGKTYDLEGILAKVVFWFVFVIGISASLNQLNLNSISTPFANMVNQVLLFVPNFIAAVAIGFVGWLLATVARTAIKIGLDKTSLDEKLSAEVGVQPMTNHIADIVYWFILLMFLPMILGKLGLNGLLEPVTNMVAKILDFIPNLLIAGVLFAVGYIIAKVLRAIVTDVIAGLNIQSIAERAGISDHTRLPKIAGSLVFLLVIIFTLIISLDALKVEVISRPATNMLNQIMAAIPNIIAAAAILGIAYYVIRFVAHIISGLLANTGIDDVPNKVGLQEALGQKKLSDLIGTLIIFFTMLFASIEAANRLGFERVSDLIALFIQFGADIVLGTVILFIGFWLANIIARIVERSEQGSKFLANIVRVLVMGLVLAMGLRAMGIADSIVNLAFGLTLGAVAVAFALSFGLGGQEAAARYLRRLQDRIDAEKNASSDKPTAQIENKANTSSTFDSDDLK